MRSNYDQESVSNCLTHSGLNVPGTYSKGTRVTNSSGLIGPLRGAADVPGGSGPRTLRSLTFKPTTLSFSAAPLPATQFPMPAGTARSRSLPLAQPLVHPLVAATPSGKVTRELPEGNAIRRAGKEMSGALETVSKAFHELRGKGNRLGLRLPILNRLFDQAHSSPRAPFVKVPAGGGLRGGAVISLGKNTGLPEASSALPSEWRFPAP